MKNLPPYFTLSNSLFFFLSSVKVFFPLSLHHFSWAVQVKALLKKSRPFPPVFGLQPLRKVHSCCRWDGIRNLYPVQVTDELRFPRYGHHNDFYCREYGIKQVFDSSNIYIHTYILHTNCDGTSIQLPIIRPYKNIIQSPSIISEILEFLNKTSKICSMGSIRVLY